MSDPNLPPVDVPPPRTSVRAEWLKVVAGFFAGLFVSVALLSILSMALYGGFGQMRGRTAMVSSFGSFALQVIVLIPLAIWGFRMWRRKRPGGLLSGAVLGCCVGTLLVGACSGLMLGIGLFSPR